MRFSRTWAAILALALALPGGAASAGEVAEFNRARVSFAKNHPKTFARSAARIPSRSAYRPLVDYWEAGMALRRRKTAPMDLLRLNSLSPYVRERAARSLAEHYLRTNEFKAFEDVVENGGVSPCADAVLQIRRRSLGATAAVRALWEEDEKFDDDFCVAAYRRARAAGMLSEDDFWIKLRNVAGGGRLSDTRRFLSKFSLNISYRSVRRVVNGASAYIARKHDLSKRENRELLMIAAIAAARRRPDQAVKRWGDFAPYFSQANNDHVWQKLGERAARAHRDYALKVFRRSETFTGENSSARAWRVRAALRAGDYAEALDVISRMPREQASLSAWRYWRAAAMQELGGDSDVLKEADEEMRAIARDHDDFYGLLAREDLGIPLSAVMGERVLPAIEDAGSPNSAESGAEFADVFGVETREAPAVRARAKPVSHKPRRILSASAGEAKADPVPRKPRSVPATPPSAQQLRRARGDFAMALAVRRAGQSRMARRIWEHAAEHAAPADVLSASRAAEDAKWYLASINGANTIHSEESHPLRYPMPYSEVIDRHAEKFGLDRAFVYGVIRRESRFMPKAISSARARGLMQVIPATALKVAQRHGYTAYRLSRLTRVDTNVIIGSTYLRDLSRPFAAHPVHVASAYNAGPSRAARWRRANSGRDILVHVENIPFLETRLYVKAVLANRAHYGARLGGPERSMRGLAEQAMQEAFADAGDFSATE